MNSPNAQTQPRMTLLGTAACAALLAVGAGAHAAEGYRLRQAPVGMFAGEMAASASNPGFFGTASLSYARISKVVDASGNDISVAARAVPLPTGTPTRGAVPDGAYTLNVAAGSIDFNQTQTQLNLVAGYLTETTCADGRLAFAMNLPLIKQSRTFSAVQPLGTVSPTPPGALPAVLRGAIAAVATAANNQVQAGVAATAASHNADATGLGDTELSMVWVRHQDRLKVAAGVSLFVPTGDFDKARGPNPGFGNFVTLRPGVAVTYALNPNHSASDWDAGVTLAGRVSFGINSTNRDTAYRSGNFVYAEAGAVKVMGNWAVGANLLAVQQVSDDTGVGAPAGGNRYRNYGAGPFVSYKLPGKDAGFNLSYSQNFGGRNALVAQTVQLRFIKAW